MRRILITALAVAAPLLSLAATASAQPYEDVFGPPHVEGMPDVHDTGARRVTPVSACPDAAGGGFIAVGTTTTTTTTGPSSDVLLVRTDATGATLWEKTYDVGPGRADRGRAVAEVQNHSAQNPPGYIIAGSSRGEPPFGQDVLLMKVDCAGEPLWKFTYHALLAGVADEAADVVEAKTGNVAFNTQSGDILVAGTTRNSANSTQDALLMRTNADGTMIWNRRYLTSLYNEELRALTETEPSIDDQETGDVVAVGRLRDINALSFEAHALRVDGNTGLIGFAPPQGAWRYGTGAEGFESVVELSAAPFNLVMVGSTGTNASDVWAVRTANNPGFVLAQRRVYSDKGSMSGREVALDVNEISNLLPIAPQGRLALTGYADYVTSSSSNLDAFLLVIHPGSLAPISMEGELFGDHGDNGDWKQTGVSLADHAGGFIIAGTWDDGDSQDLYLVNTDGNGETRCSLDWKVEHETTMFPFSAMDPTPNSFLYPMLEQVRVERRDTRKKNCP